MFGDSCCPVCGEEVFDDQPSQLQDGTITHDQCAREDVDDDPCFDRDLDLED